MEYVRGSVIFFLCLLLTSCTNINKTAITAAIDKELAPLTELDEDLLAQYPSFAALFKESENRASLEKLGAQVISLYFKDFRYRVTSVQINDRKATAKVHITTKNAREVAKDFEKGRMKLEVKYLNETDSTSYTFTSQAAYELLKEVLQKNTYHLQENDIEINLINSGKRWKVVRDAQLENNLLGGLVSQLSNPFLLSVNETLEAWLAIIKEMDFETMCKYLGIDSFLNSQKDPLIKEMGLAIAKQIDSCFSASILSCERTGYHATAEVAITSFDSAAVQSAFQESLDLYLATPAALTDGEEGRYEKACRLLTVAINNNAATTTRNITLSLQNDGSSWCIAGGLSDMADALLGNITQDIYNKS